MKEGTRVTYDIHSGIMIHAYSAETGNKRKERKGIAGGKRKGGR